MAKPRYLPKGKKYVSLYGLEQLGLILFHPSGIIYSNQTGGHSCIQSAEEGSLVILGFYDGCPTLQTQLKQELENVCWLSEQQADAIDVFFKSHFGSLCLTIDRSRMKDSMEAWLYVDVADQPAYPPHAHWSILNLEEQNQYTEIYPHIERPNSFSFYGFGPSKGVLTWPNSD